MPFHRHGPWTSHEDDVLRHLVQSRGANGWIQIQNVIVTRTAKQCRERWHNNLRPDLIHTPITAEEGVQINYLFTKYGPKWATIARHIPGRSENAVKNWYNGGVNKRKRATTRVPQVQHQTNSYFGPQLPLPVMYSSQSYREHRSHALDLPTPNIPYQNTQKIMTVPAQPTPVHIPLERYHPSAHLSEEVSSSTTYDQSLAFISTSRHSPSAWSNQSIRTPSLVADNGSASTVPSPTTPSATGDLPGPWQHQNHHHQNHNHRLDKTSSATYESPVCRPGNQAIEAARQSQVSARNSMMDIHSIIQ